MDQNRFDTLTRSLTTGWRRRAVISALGATLAPLLGGADADAHNPFKACKKKSGQQKKACLKRAKAHNAQHAAALLPPPPPLSCSELCSSDCAYCYTRADGSYLCGNGAGTVCPWVCTSDTDCIGTGHPYCLASQENRATGQIFTICGGTPACAEVKKEDLACREN
jgi:hypothetical protein